MSTNLCSRFHYIFNIFKFNIFRSKMSPFSKVLMNTICHIIIDGHAQEQYYVITHFIMLLQTIACIVDTSSTLYLVVKWVDPSTFLDPKFTVILCFAINMSFLLIIIVKLIITKGGDMLVRPNILKIYLGNLLLHLQMLCKTAVLSPLIRSSLLQIQSPSSGVMTVLALLSLLIYILFLLPVSLYNTSNTFILTPQINKKLTYINIYLILNLFRVIFAFVSALNQSFTPIPCALFFLIFMGMSIKQPVFAYSHEKIIKGMISTIAYLSLCSVLQFAMNQQQYSLPLQLVGIISFVAFIDWLSQFRIRRILDLKQPTVHQIKIIVFLITNIKQEIKKLEYFIFQHRKYCPHPNCHCTAVIEHLASAEGKLDNDKIWYEFLVSYTGNYCCLEEIEKLPENQMMHQIEKYQHIVIDLAEIHLFKLRELNSSYYIVSVFRHFLDAKGISFISFNQKKKIINYYMQEEISLKYHINGAANLYAGKFMDFQMEYERYRKLLLRSANKVTEMWQQMNNRQPNDSKLHQCIKKLEQWHQCICKMYDYITKAFDKSADILSKITKDYFLLVLNIPQKSPFHVIKQPIFWSSINKQENSEKNKKIEKISENMQSFSLDSSTPMCFVSVDEHTFGKIMGNNYFFNQIMNVEYGKIAFIQEFMIPEMRSHHRQSMKAFIKGDGFSLEHKNGFTLNTKGKIIYTKILVQIMPSIQQGLRYTFFLKKLMPHRKIVGMKNNATLAYSSQSFDDAFEMKIIKQPVVSYLTEQVIREIREKKEIRLTIEETELFITFLHEFTHKDISYFFVQFCEEEDILRQTQYNLLGGQIYNTSSKYKEVDFLRSTDRKDSVMSHESSGFMEKVEFDKSTVQDQSSSDRIKKEAEIRSVYSIIVDNKKKNISRRVVIFTIIISFLFTTALLTSVFLKQKNQTTYLQATHVNNAYHNLMMIMAKDLAYLKLVNFLSFLNQHSFAQMFFQSIDRQSITSVMDKLVINFDIPSITQNWNTFNCNSNNNTFTMGKQSIFLTISEYFQNNLANLATFPISSFSFPFSSQYQSIPLTDAERLYNEMIVNGIYVALPGFRSLKANVMDQITFDRVNTKAAMLVTYAIQISIFMVFVLGMFIFNKGVTKLKNDSYQLFEGLDKQLVKEKENNCNQFIAMYTDFNEDQKYDTKTFIKQTNNRQSEMQLYPDAAITKSVSEQQTEREFGDSLLRSKNNSHNNIERDSNIHKLNIEDKHIRKEKSKIGQSDKIFKKSSIVWLFLKHFFSVIPLILFSIVFASLEVKQVDNINNFLRIQEQIQTLQLDINLLYLYQLQYAIYDPSLQGYLSIPAYLNDLIDQMYTIERNFVGNQYDLSLLPLTEQFFNSIGYSDLCAMNGNGDFLNSTSPQTIGIITPCLNVSNQRLTKGFYASIIEYLQSANTLMLANPNTTAKNASQRLKFLNSPFFTKEGLFIIYFDNILTTMRSKFDQDYANQIQNSTNLLVYTAISLLGLLLLLVIIFSWLSIKSLKLQIMEITCILLLISYESIIKNESLQNQFTAKMQEFRKLK